MGYIGDIAHLLTFDPNFPEYPSSSTILTSRFHLQVGEPSKGQRKVGPRRHQFWDAMIAEGFPYVLFCKGFETSPLGSCKMVVIHM